MRSVLSAGNWMSGFSWARMLKRRLDPRKVPERWLRNRDCGEGVDEEHPAAAPDRVSRAGPEVQRESRRAEGLLF